MRIDRVTAGALLCLLVAGCDPFAALSQNDDRVVPDGDGPKVTLFSPHRRLPKSATNIHVHFENALDSEMEARFDAPINDARAFLRAMVGHNGVPCTIDYGLYPSIAPPGPRPANSICGGDEQHHNDGRYAIDVDILPRGTAATVLVRTFTT